MDNLDATLSVSAKARTWGPLIEFAFSCLSFFFAFLFFPRPLVCAQKTKRHLWFHQLAMAIRGEVKRWEEPIIGVAELAARSGLGGAR